jgi:ABC-type transport system involved in multi-copper enzyme maturation permease subunit
MTATLRFTWRLQRLELLVLIGGPLLLAAAAAFVAWQLTAVAGQVDACYGQSLASGLTAACSSSVSWGNLMTQLSPVLLGAATVTPLLVGILLGAPLLAREIDHRTPPLAWSLTLSRTRWLVARALPLVIAVVVVLLMLGQASEALILATPPGELGFRTFGTHGPMLAAIGLAVFGIGLLVGLVMGRVLPAILMTGLLTMALLAGLQLVRGQLMRAEAVWLDAQANNDALAMTYGSAYTDDTTGTLITDEEAQARFPAAFAPGGSYTPPGMTQVYLATPPNLYPVFVAREIAELGAVFVITAALALLAIRSRRPE